MERLRRIFALAVMLWGSQACADAEEITLASPAYWCPFSCTAGEAQEGFTVEIIRWIFAQHDIKVRLVNQNYSRALSGVRDGRYTATPSTFRDEAPDFTFPDEPVSANRFCFYTAQADTWTYAGVASLKGRSVGIIQNYAYGPALDALIRSQPQTFRVNSGNDLTLRLIQQLQRKRFDTFVEEENLVDYSLLRHPGHALRVAGCEAEKFAYMAISPKHPRRAEYARMFSAGMHEIRRNGVLDKILSAYGLKDWRD